MKSKVAIVGLSPSKDQAPVSDREWDLWTLAWGHDKLEESDRIFEMHIPPSIPREVWENSIHKDNCISQLNYPLEEIIDKYDDFFTCSVDYMLALAIYEGYSTIALYGVDNTFEYISQKASLAYWIGVAKGEGIEVVLPKECEILTIIPDLRWEYNFPKRYGYLD